MIFMNAVKIGAFRIVLMVVLSVALLSSSVFCDKAVAARSQDERAALLEKAKEEGKIVWYTTTAPDQFVKGFREKYPFMEVEPYRAGEDKVLLRITTEERAKKHNFDVVNVTMITSEILKSKGMYARYLSPEREFYPAISKDPEGYWTDYFLNLTILGYNTNLVSAREVPKTWNDLLDPKWKGKIGMDTKAYWWFANMVKVMGEKKGLEYMKRLGDQDIRFRNGRTLNSQMTAAGEVALVATVYNYMIEELKSRGAPVEWVAIDPVVPELHPLAISSHAPHPNAARLFMDFMLSREGQEILASTFRIPSRMDVDAKVPKLKKGINILPIDYSLLQDYEKYGAMYRKILMKR